MPLREGAFVPMETLPRAQRVLADHEFQTYWYRHVGQFVRGRSVLDAGAGMGYGRKLLLSAGASGVECYDLVSLVAWVKVSDISLYADASFDWVVAMDVIEHVENADGFLGHMLRVARDGVFFSTPNWLVFKAKNEHHRREYTPEELLSLVDSYKPSWRSAHYWGGDEHSEITDRGGTLPADDGACNFGVLLEK